MLASLRPPEATRKWWTLGAMCFALFAIMLDNTVVNVALAEIQEDLALPLSGLAWIVNAYTLAFGVLLVTGGRLGDLLGRRRMFLFGVVVFAVASVAVGLAPNEGTLIAARGVQGAGAAFMMPGTLSIISDAFAPEERGKAIGIWAGVSGIALALGPLVGGALAEESWRWIFFLNVPVAILAIAGTLLAARESFDRRAGRGLDPLGILVLSIGLTALVLALVQGHEWGWRSTVVLGLLALAAVALAAFPVIEARMRAPILDFRFFRSATFLGANLVAFVISFAMFGLFFYIALYMQNILGYNAGEVGLRFLPATLILIVVAPFAGKLTDKIGPRPPMVAGLLLVAAGLAILGRITFDTGYTLLLPAFLLMGLGIGLTMAPMTTAAMNAVSVEKAGAASGIVSMSRQIGGVIGIAAINALFETVGRRRLDETLAAADLPLLADEELVPNLAAVTQLEPMGPLDPDTAAIISSGAADAFLYALPLAMTLSAVFVFLGAVAALFLVRRGRDAPIPEPDPLPERAPEPARGARRAARAA